MCGIVGISSRFPLSNIDNSIELMSHRGPDDSGYYVNNNIGVSLGHRRLSIQDVSISGHQPMKSINEDAVIVFNGEIYNFPQLRLHLKSINYRFVSQTDTEVLINLYLQYGESMLDMLNGIFTFAILDIKKEELFIARDAFGVKPLYYNMHNGVFTFSSEIKSLMPLVNMDHELNLSAIDRYLTFLWSPGYETPIQSITKLQPGEALIVNKGDIKKQWHWYKLPLFSNNPKPDWSVTESILRTKKQLFKAVERQMISDVPVGAFLSGGLDSSAVVAMASQIQPSIQCFTIEASGYKSEGIIDDLPYARRVAKHLNVQLEVVTIDSKQMAHDFESMIYQLDEPIADPAALNVLYISQLAKKHGIKVLLSGAGGDDIFTGYRRHYAINIEHYWRWLPQSFRKLLEDSSARLNQKNPHFRRISKFFSGAGLNADANLVNYFRWIKRSDLYPLYTQEFRDALCYKSAEGPMLQFIADLPQSTHNLDKMLALEQRFFLPDHNLLYTDKMSMAAGVEVRVPFLDLQLVELAHKISLKYKQNGRHGKWVLKKAMEPYLPHHVIYRPKTGFGAPLRGWIRNELSELLRDILSTHSLKKRGLFDPAAVHKLIKSNNEGRVDASYTLLSLLAIEIWCRRFIDMPYNN